MKELSIVITVTPIGKMKKASYTFIADPFEFNCVLEKTSSGNYFSCDKDINIELPDIDTVHEFYGGRRVVLHMKDSSDRIINIGTVDIPALVSIVPNLNSATLSIVCKMLRSPFVP